MDHHLASILKLLDQISVRGEDVERLAAAKHMLRQLYVACSRAKEQKEEGVCPTSQPHTDTKSI